MSKYGGSVIEVWSSSYRKENVDKIRSVERQKR